MKFFCLPLMVHTFQHTGETAHNAIAHLVQNAQNLIYESTCSRRHCSRYSTFSTVPPPSCSRIARIGSRISLVSSRRIPSVVTTPSKTSHAAIPHGHDLVRDRSTPGINAPISANAWTTLDKIDSHAVYLIYELYSPPDVPEPSVRTTRFQTPWVRYSLRDHRCLLPRILHVPRSSTAWFSSVSSHSARDYISRISP